MTHRADLSTLTITTVATLRDALAAIDKGGSGVCLVVDNSRLYGLITDGDVRRALLAGIGLDGEAIVVATTEPTTVPPDTSRAAVLDLMRARRMDAVPIIDVEGTLLGLHTLSDMIGRRPLPNHAVIMAGGKGTRLGALTDATPKPLLEVAGRPIIEWAVLELVGSGIGTIHVSVGHLADQIVDHLGDGSAFGAEIDYVHDQATPLGTAGALGLVSDQHPGLDTAIVVVNGDIMARLDFAELLATHDRAGAAVTVGVRRYAHRVPYGVVESTGDRLTGLTEKPTIELEVGAGVYAVEPAALSLVPRDTPSTMPELVQRCLDEGRPVHTWTVHENWIDVGTPGDLTLARGGQAS